MTTLITFKEMKTTELRDLTLNYEELTPFSKFVLNGNTKAVFNGQYIDLYLGNRRYYSLGFTKYEADDWHSREGYELVG